MIVNSLQFLKDTNYQQLKLMTSCNDCTVRIFDFETMRTLNQFNFTIPINIANISPDGNYLGVYGDCLQADILDIRSGKTVASLHGHEDYGFAFVWHHS